MKHFFILFFIYSFQLFAQKETANWYFGNNAGLDFNTNPPGILTNSAMKALEGCSTMSDSWGHLLFYSNGDTIWTSQHQVMANGTGLFSNLSTTQSCLIVKRPGSSSIYYIFTLDAFGGGNGLSYSIVDMSLAAGMGSVIVKNTPLYTPSTEKLTGVRHCNGTDIWVISHEWNSNNFRAYLVSSSGVNPVPVISSAGTVHSGITAMSEGQMKVSPNGKKIVLAIPLVTTFPSGIVELFDFNNVTGIVSNPLLISNVFASAYGCEFSPDGTKVYCARNLSTIYQWDLCAGSGPAIIASQFSISTTPFFPRAMQLGPDGKIYIANNTSTLNMIANPNAWGNACNYIGNALPLGSKKSNSGLPNFISSLVKAPFTYTQGLGCFSALFSPPSIAIGTLAGCMASGYTVTGMAWNFGDPASGVANTSTASNPSHTFPSLGSYSVSLVIHYAACAPDTIRQTITLVGSNLTIQSASATCSGLGTATVSAFGGSGQYSYNWLPSLQSTSLATNLSMGLHTVSVSDNLVSGCFLTLTTNITAPQQISSVVNSTISCTTASAGMSVSGGSGSYSYSWAPVNYTTANVAGLSPGSYTIHVYDSINQCTVSKTIHILQLPNPTLNITGDLSLCIGETTTLTASGADAFLWNTSSTAIAIPVTITATTVYSVIGTNTNSCSGSKIVTVTVSKCTGVSNQNDENYSLKIYPNPNTGEFTVEADSEMSLTLVNEAGQIVRTIILSGSNNYKYSVTNLTKGVYFITGQKNRAQINKKLVVTK